ncbi:MAG TPA: glycosyltransferase family 4 protein [Nitrososphaeraceae archaeon]|nr:glycosyltransferase family 4 protein [Nitrososphaeraceae archaeon]
MLRSINMPRILMISTEYPPMQGGVGRYTYNLTKALRKLGFEVDVVSNKLGNGEFSGLSPENPENYSVLLDIVEKMKPDLVHVQYEHGLYGLKLDPINPRRTSTNIDLFYKYCQTPIVTTFHSAYPFKQWFNLMTSFKDASKRNMLRRFLERVMRYWKMLLNYYSFHNLNKEKLAMSEAGIVFSHYMTRMIGSCEVILHGAEPSSSLGISKKEARKSFNLPESGRIALALGFMTATKGWDIIQKMDIPEGWTIVVNSSKNHYSTEKFNPNLDKNNVVNLQEDFLTEKQLSLLFSSADAVILPYTVSSGSGVMFDALAHGLPFIATNLEFFQEFSQKGLGITVRRSPDKFSKALEILDKNYMKYTKAVESFQKEIRWHSIASQHAQIYAEIIKAKQSIIAM